MKFSPKKLIAAPKIENHVVSYTGEVVELDKKNGTRYFENTYESDDVLLDRFKAGASALTEIFAHHMQTPIVLSGYADPTRTTLGTTRANKNLQVDLETWAKASNLPFDYFVAFFKSITMELAIDGPKISIEEKLAIAVADYEAAKALALESKVSELKGLVADDMLNTLASTMAAGEIALLTEKHAAVVVKLESDKKRRDTQNANNSTAKAEAVDSEVVASDTTD